jgi:hypothetical protein
MSEVNKFIDDILEVCRKYNTQLDLNERDIEVEFGIVEYNKPSFMVNGVEVDMEMIKERQDE